MSESSPAVDRWKMFEAVAFVIVGKMTSMKRKRKSEPLGLESDSALQLEKSSSSKHGRDSFRLASGRRLGALQKGTGSSLRSGLETASNRKGACPFSSVFSRRQSACARRAKTEENSPKQATKKSDFYRGYRYVRLDSKGHEDVIPRFHEHQVKSSQFIKFLPEIFD